VGNIGGSLGHVTQIPFPVFSVRYIRRPIAMCNRYKRIDHCLRKPVYPVAAIDVFGNHCDDHILNVVMQGVRSANHPDTTQRVHLALKGRNAKPGSIGAVWPNVPPGS
jgi:hypothetical protein